MSGSDGISFSEIVEWLSVEGAEVKFTYDHARQGYRADLTARNGATDTGIGPDVESALRNLLNTRLP